VRRRFGRGPAADGGRFLAPVPGGGRSFNAATACAGGPQVGETIFGDASTQPSARRIVRPRKRSGAKYVLLPCDERVMSTQAAGFEPGTRKIGHGQ